MGMKLEQLNAMTDLELDEAVAMAQKWTVINGKWKTPVYNNENEEVVCNYHPTANTSEGKAQAFDLMVKYELNVDIRVGHVDFISTETSYAVFIDIYDASLGEELSVSRAIVIASILSAQEK